MQEKRLAHRQIFIPGERRHARHASQFRPRTNVQQPATQSYPAIPALLLLNRLNLSASQILANHLSITNLGQPSQCRLVDSVLNGNDVTVEKNVLTIKGEKTAEKPAEAGSYASIERFSGTFQRRFRLPDVVDSDRVSAAARHGLIEITVPKAEAHHPQRIAITG